MKTAERRKVIVIPCSGIGKALGSISREATYEIVEKRRRGAADTTCLALLVSGDEAALELVQHNLCITIDGCPLQCAEKNVRLVGGNLAAGFKVIDFLAKNGSLKPKKVTFLDDDGIRLANIVAKEVAEKVDELLSK